MLRVHKIHFKLLFLALFHLLILSNPLRAENLKSTKDMELQVKEWLSVNEFSGGLRFGIADDILFETYRGKLGVTSNQVPSEHTQFNLASTSKLLTVTTLAVLLKQHNQTLESKAVDLLPKLRALNFPKNISVRELLAHQAGLPPFLTFGDVHLPNLKSQDDYWKSLISNITFGGKKHVQKQTIYSNADYVILGRIVEKLSGDKEYYDAVNQTILTPLKMSRTNWPLNSSLSDTYASGMLVNKGKTISNSSLIPARGSSAGGAYSSIYDLTLFISYLIEKCNEGVLNEYIQPQGSLDEMISMGAGFMSIELPSGTWYGHTGLAPGTTSVVMFNPANKAWVVGLSNNATPVSELAMTLASQL